MDAASYGDAARTATGVVAAAGALSSPLVTPLDTESRAADLTRDEVAAQQSCTRQEARR